MPRVKTSPPPPTKEKGQRSIPLPEYLTRYLPQWKMPEWYDADVWRRVVRHQPVAMICRDTLIANHLSLEWKIEPRDSTKRDELKEDIDYYTKFLEDNGDCDYSRIIEWIDGDYLDIPFGAGVELGWSGDTSAKDNPNSRLLWFKLLDGATLFPTLNTEWPVGQMIKYSANDTIYFPKHAINRMYMSPRSEILREGWGMACPEKIFLALELINRGDVYYANLLLDTPEVGILDLGDIDEVAAKEWIKGWKELLVGVDPFKVPILYGNKEKSAQFISFTRSPTELIFDRTITRYSAIIAAGYGMSLSDIGVQVATSGGETLAGSIRQERRTRKTGLARLKLAGRLFFNRMLPDTLRLVYIDLDDELSVALGRARLANSQAWATLIDKKVFTPTEARQQTVADGLVSISVPEELSDEQMDEFPMPAPALGAPTNGSKPKIGNPVPPSKGGQGEVRPTNKADVFDYMYDTSPEFKEIVDELEHRWDDLTMNEKDAIKVELDSCLAFETIEA